ncbi:WD40/YVTN/BNR-like repeat-containing protein [Acidobacteriota bacterium]
MKKNFFLCSKCFFSLVIILFGLNAYDLYAGEDFDSELITGLKYRCIGPTRGGRVTAVAGVHTQPDTFYMGACGGGIWKTSDYGQNWINVSDGYFSTGSIGAIRVALSDPAVIYAGTGSDGIRSNVITGRGVYKSTDSGKTWQFLGLKNVGQIGAVEIDPVDPDIVFVAALGQAFGPNPERGVFRTKDGGKNWEKVLFISDKIGAADLEFAPDDPLTIYASMWRAERKPWTIISGGTKGGVYKSIDGGETWKQLTKGLPSGIRGKSDLAVSQEDPARLYVLMEAAEPDGALYRSDDRGESFHLVTTYAPLLDRPFYYCNLDADPTNADTLYSNSTGFMKSIDGGKNWKRLSTPHGDNHDMWINPKNPDIFIQSNDGGANVTRDGGKTWSTQHNQPTAELYQIAVDDQYPYWVYAGQQDNSTIMVPSQAPYSPASGSTAFWRAVGGCETGPAVPKPGNHNIVYSNCKGRFGRYHKITGQEKQYYVGAANMYGHNPKDLKYRFQRVSPIHVSPHDPNVVYHASQFLHKTTDEGVTWETISPDLTANEPDKQVISGSPITRDITGEEFYSTIYAVQESTLEKGLIWVGANDGPVHVTRDGGKSWTDVTPADLPPGGRVQTVEPSPHQQGKAYFATYRYLLGDWEPYIYKTEDYGETWTRLTTGNNGIPSDSPTRVVREDPDREGLLYAGTEFGMFISFDDGIQWFPFQLNLPVTPVTDIKIYRKDLILSTMGRSFWILDNLTPLHQIETRTDLPEFTLFSPQDAYRTSSSSFRRQSQAVPEYPESGVKIDYLLKMESKEDIQMSITSMSGVVIRTFSSTQGIPRITKKEGLHRIIWDMRREIIGEESEDSSRRRSRGPLVVPGQYKVELSVGEWKLTQNFKILMDPRVVDDGVTVSDLNAQEQICLDVLNLQVLARKTISIIKKEQKKLVSLIDKAGRTGNLAQQDYKKWSIILQKLETAKGRYPQPMILDQIGYLYGMISRADQKPGRDAYMRYQELREAVSQCRQKINQLLLPRK